MNFSTLDFDPKLPEDEWVRLIQLQDPNFDTLSVELKDGIKESTRQSWKNAQKWVVQPITITHNNGNVGKFIIGDVPPLAHVTPLFFLNILENKCFETNEIVFRVCKEDYQTLNKILDINESLLFPIKG